MIILYLLVNGCACNLKSFILSSRALQLDYSWRELWNCQRKPCWLFFLFFSCWLTLCIFKWWSWHDCKNRAHVTSWDSRGSSEERTSLSRPFLLILCVLFFPPYSAASMGVTWRVGAESINNVYNKCEGNQIWKQALIDSTVQTAVNRH